MHGLPNLNPAANYPQSYKTTCLNSVLKQSITGPHLEPNKCSPHIPKLIQNTFQYYPYINGYDFHKVSCLQIAIQISKS